MSVFVSSAVMLDAALLLSGLQSLAEPHAQPEVSSLCSAALPTPNPHPHRPSLPAQ